MAKTVFFSEETVNGIDRVLETEYGEAVYNYGKGNFLLGASTVAIFAGAAYGIYQVGKLGALVIKYLKS